MCSGVDEQGAGDRQSDGDLKCHADSRTVGMADRLAVGVSPLTRPDSFHAGTCRSEREDRVRLGAFDVGVALAFEVAAHFLPPFAFFKPCCVRRSSLPGAGAGRPQTLTAKNRTPASARNSRHLHHLSGRLGDPTFLLFCPLQVFGFLSLQPENIRRSLFCFKPGNPGLACWLGFPLSGPPLTPCSH